MCARNETDFGLPAVENRYRLSFSSTKKNRLQKTVAYFNLIGYNNNFRIHQNNIIMDY